VIERTAPTPSLSERLLAYSVLSASCVAFALFAGKDLSWDFLNYHFYAGFSAFGPRLNIDFFPATAPSYFVPYAYAPLYAMVAAGLDDHVVVGAMALWGSTALWGVWELGGLLSPRKTPHGLAFGRSAAYASVGLAAVAPVFFIQLGTSFIDVPTAAFVVWGYVLLMRFAFSNRDMHLVSAALLMGVAVGLKQTNVIHAVASVALLAASGFADLKRFVVYGAVGILGGAGVMAPWAVQLYREFGNPVFPSLNQIFGSPDFPLNGEALHYRFIPDSWVDALARPLWMASPESGVYTEPPAPDARYLLVFLLATFGAVFVILRMGVVGWDAARADRPGFQRLLGLTASFMTAWILWLAASGNGRYFMPMALLTGALLPAWIFAISQNHRWRVYALLAVSVLAVALPVLGSSLRYSQVPWTGRYVDVSIPEELKKEPAVFLSLDTQPAAFIVPLIHPASSWASVVGMHVIDPSRAGWRRIEVMLHGDRQVRFVLPVEPKVDGGFIAPNRTFLDFLTARLGFEVDNADCLPIVLQSVPSSGARIVRREDGIPQIVVKNEGQTIYAACVGKARPELRERYVRQVGEVNELFDEVVRRCPRLFPQEAVTEGIDEDWRRIYVATDLVLLMNSGKIQYRRFGQNVPRSLGTQADIREGKFEIECHRRRDPLLTREALAL